MSTFTSPVEGIRVKTLKTKNILSQIEHSPSDQDSSEIYNFLQFSSFYLTATTSTVFLSWIVAQKRKLFRQKCFVLVFPEWQENVTSNLHISCSLPVLQPKIKLHKQLPSIWNSLHRNFQEVSTWPLRRWIRENDQILIHNIDVI